MEKNNFDIKRFTSSVAVYLLNAIAESIEFHLSEVEAIGHIYDAFDKLAITMENKGVEVTALTNDHLFIKKAARTLLIVINDDNADYNKIKAEYESLFSLYKENFEHDFLHMTQEELENLGFVRWMDENPLMLIPIWIYRLLPEGMKLTNINGGKAETFDQEIRVDRPIDIRFGHLGWGYYLETKEEAL